MDRLSHRTITSNMPAIKAIFSALERDTYKYKELDKKDVLHIFSLEKEFGQSKLIQAMDIINTWIEGSVYKAEVLIFTKKKNTKWKNLLDLIGQRISMFENDVSLIEIKINKDGEISRDFSGDILKLDGTLSEMRLKIIERLVENKNKYMKTKELCDFVGSKNTESLLKLTATMNSKIKSVLQLSKNMIEVEKRIGFRIDPFYRIVFIKK